MKICINGVTREMTQEEEAKYFPQTPTEEAEISDYENALLEMGVDFSD